MKRTVLHLFHLFCVNDDDQRYVAVSRQRVEFVNRRASAGNQRLSRGLVRVIADGFNAGAQ